MLKNELMAVPGTDLHSLDSARLQNYLKDIISDPDIPKTDEDWEKRLGGLGLLVEGGDNHLCCSIAGLLLFGKCPRRFLKQSGLRVFVFKGNDKSYQAILDESLDATSVGRWEIESSGKRLIDSGLIEKLIAQIKPFITEEAATIDENLRRDTSWLYPLEALREVIINALAHRDWTRSVDIEIGIYTDRLEVVSPGALQNSMTVEKMVSGQRSPRNTLLMEILRDYGYVDFRGMGIRTKVIPLMKKLNEREPVFDATEDYLKTILPHK